MFAIVSGETLQCPHCLSTDSDHFAVERRVLWHEPILEMFEDKGLLVLIADCDNTLVDMAGSGPDCLYCANCGNRSDIDVTTLVHHSDPKV
jgi:hypothetical protein